MELICLFKSIGGIKQKHKNACKFLKVIECIMDYWTRYCGYGRESRMTNQHRFHKITPTAKRELFYSIKHCP